jgi:hypothetical protein
MARTPKVRREFDTLLMLSAACAAQRVNKAYLKFADGSPNSESPYVTRPSNRELVYQFLDNLDTITDADRELAEKVKTYWNGKTFKLLTGEYISNFDRSVLELLQKEKLYDGYDLAVVASLPNSYLSGVARDERERRVKFAAGGYLGSIGDTVEATIEVTKSVYSKKWGVYFLTGITTGDQAVFFSYKQDVSPGTILSIKGNVKRQDNNTTQLNRVKVL